MTMTGQPTLRVSFDKGRSETLIEFKYSVGYIIPPSLALGASLIELALWYTFSCPGNIARILKFISSTSSLWAERMECSEKYWSLAWDR
jgi:hypothetical protein